MEHKTTVVPVLGGWMGQCACRAHSGKREAHWEAEDWGIAHIADVQRVRAHLRERAPTLRDQYAYYRERENDPHTPESERRWWKVLADGLEHRLGLPHTEEAMF
jgi:hypothetical protein